MLRCFNPLKKIRIISVTRLSCHSNDLRMITAKQDIHFSAKNLAAIGTSATTLMAGSDFWMPAILGAPIKSTTIGKAALAAGSTTGVANSVACKPNEQHPTPKKWIISSTVGGFIGGAYTGLGVALSVNANWICILGCTLVGGIAGATSGAAYASSVGGLLNGPYKYCLLGGDVNDLNLDLDCWKLIVRNTSKDPSQGKRLVDVLKDPRVEKVEVFNRKNGSLLVTNQWGELFLLEVFCLPKTGRVLAHAKPFKSVM